ncbi:MAG TPA: glycosyltransferase family 4 protein [Candidatus Thermoplasmatota archaeon]|nr:glycosyltransferase family 4 protein [Candidatus Thermoplasmatota archaeon]
MRVLQVCIRFPPALGGVETHVHQLGAALAARGHAVEVATSDLRSEFPWARLAEEELVDAGPLAVHRFRAATLGGSAHWPWMQGLAGWLARRARTFDVLHAHSYGYHHTLAALLAARLARTPMVLTPHFHPHWSMELGARRQQLRGAFDATLGWTQRTQPDAIVCVSRAEAALLAARAGKVRVIPNGVDPAPWAAARGEGLRARLGVRGPVALYVGRLAGNKGLPTLLDAWARLPAGDLLVVGEGHLRAQVEERAARPDLAGRVRLLGPVPDAQLREATAACDVLVLPSEYEAFGIVLLEAMAAGKPCVAARAGGMPEVVEDGVTGLLVPHGDAAALAAALAQLANDPKLAAAMGRAGQQRVQDRYTWSAVAERTEALYRELTAS